MKIIDDQGQNMVDVKWHSNTSGTWITQDIPDGEEIIGLYISTNTVRKDLLQNLGFMTWKPN